jgi:hypothetical protein
MMSSHGDGSQKFAESNKIYAPWRKINRLGRKQRHNRSVETMYQFFKRKFARGGETTNALKTLSQAAWPFIQKCQGVDLAAARRRNIYLKIKKTIAAAGVAYAASQQWDRVILTEQMCSER